VSRGTILLRVISFGVLAACMAAPSLAVDGQTTIAFAENRIGMTPADFDLGISGHGVSRHLPMNKHNKSSKAASEVMACASLSYSCLRYL
jgi:hypothetical protein